GNEAAGPGGKKPPGKRGLPPGMTRQQYEDLRAEMKGHADAAFKQMKEANARGDRTTRLPDGTVLKTSDSAMGPWRAVVKDMKTGEIFYGQNTGKQPSNLPRPLQERANSVAAANQAASKAPEGYPEGWTRDKGIPGSHSEVQAVDKGMKARPDAQPE